MRFHQYFNNAQLYISTTGCSSDVVEDLSQCLDVVEGWMGQSIKVVIWQDPEREVFFCPSAFPMKHFSPRNEMGS